jgi:hypothetical protein
MKKLLVCILWFSGSWLFAQEDRRYAVEANYFYGNIVEHSPAISHLITHYPEGVLLSFSNKTYGAKAWERRYNYPEVGATFTYQDLKNQYLGENYGLYAHMGFYFLKRHLLLKFGQGLAYATNPYNPDTNYQNNAFGSPILSTTFLSGNFLWENLFKGVGFQAGISLIHYSNADFVSPNSSTNTAAINVGVNYIFKHEKEINYIAKEEEKYSEPIHVNLVLRSGVNSARIIGTGSLPFLTFSGYADKRLSRKSTLQAGGELFFSGAMQEYINYHSSAFPKGGTTGKEDAKRVGIFAGHQLTFDKTSLLTQLGFYVYYPYEKFVDQVYNRVGLQRELYRDLFASVTVRSHGANAEAVEFSIGYRL